MFRNVRSSIGTYMVTRRALLRATGGGATLLGATGLLAASASGAGATAATPRTDTPHVPVFQRNGRQVEAGDLGRQVFAGSAHFSGMQVRGGRIRGIDLHLARLRAASLELFDQALPDEQVRSYLRAALQDGPADVSLRITMSSPAGDFTVDRSAPEVLVEVSPPSSGPQGPLALDQAEHERFLPARKIVGEISKTYYMRRAVGRGFDDAAFVDRRGRFSEGTIWNLAFWDGEAVVWPEAEMLVGTTLGIIRRQLDRIGVPQHSKEITAADLPGLAGAVVMNSATPGVAVHRIGGTPIPAAPTFLDVLRRAFDAEPLAVP